MILYYRVLAVDPADCSITVRYYSDAVGEIDLRTDPADSNVPPLRCRTDTNLTLYDHAMSEQDLHVHILRLANVPWLMLKEKVKREEVDLSVAAALVGQTFSRPVTEDGEIDLTSELL